MGKRKMQLWRSSRVSEWHAQAERKHRFVQSWRSGGELQVCGRDGFDRSATLSPLPCPLQGQTDFLEALDGDRGDNPFAAPKVSVQDGLAV